MSEAEFRLSADTTAARKEVASFRKEYAEMVRAVEKPIAQIDAFRKVQESAKAAASEFYSARQKVNVLKDAMAQAGQPVKELDRELVKAERTLAKATAEFERQKTKVREQRAELRAAGIDTRNLANEQQRLQAEMAKAVGGGRRDLAVAGIRERTAELQKQAVAQRQMNLENARQNLGVGRYRELQAELARTRQQYQLLRTNGNLTARELAVAQQQVTRRIRETQAEMRELAGLQAGGAGRLGVAGLAGAAAGAYSGLNAVRSYMQMADTVRQIDSRLRLATVSQEEFNTASEEVRRIADENGASIAAVTQLYTRLSPAMREAGRSQSDIVKIIEVVSRSMRISGASAAESEGAIVQFAQALGSGALRGDEFNSVAEAAPRLMKALADGLGVPIAALREMAKAGELTTGVVLNALIDQFPKVAEEANQLGETYEAAAQRMKNASLELVGAVDKLTGTSARTATSLSGIAGGLNQISRNEKPLEGVAKALLNIVQLTPQGQLYKGWYDVAMSLIGIDAEKALAAAASASQKYQLQQEMLEKEELDRRIRRLAGEQLAAAESKGIKLDEQRVLAAWAEAMGTTYDAFIAREQERATLRAEAERSGNELVATARREELADLQAQLATREKVLAAENKRLEAARQKTLDIEREFNSAITDIRAGSAGKGSSYLDAQDALLSSQRAKAGGDTKLAIEEARRGAKILKDLAAAGESTYGFEFLAEQLKTVAVEASRIDADKVKSEVERVKEHYDDLAKRIDALKVVSITLNTDDTSVEAVRQRMREIAADLAKVLVLKPTIVAPDYSAPYTLQEPQGFARGGWTGPGGKYQPAGLVHADEHVQPQEVVREPGALAFLERIRRNGFRETMRQLQLSGVRGYAAGGLVTARSLPAIPAPSPALLNAGNAPEFPNLGRIDWGVGGANYTIYTDSQTANELQLAARKFGRTHR